MTSRRRLLLGAAGTVLAGASGCSVGAPTSPPTSGSTNTAGTPGGGTATTTPDPQAVAAAGTLVELLSRTETVLDRSDVEDLADSRARLLRAVRDGHRQHVAALTSPEPTSRPLPSVPSVSSTPTPSREPSTGSLPAALGALAAAEQAAGRTLLHTAAATAGFASLLYASLGTACTSYATDLAATDPAKPAAVVTSRPVLAPWSETDGLQDSLAAAHALVYGYQAALGFVSEASGFGQELMARLLHFQQLRDRLTALVVAAQVEPAAAEPAYELPVQVTGTASATRLVRRLEVAAQPHFGRFVAAATTPAVHTLALAELVGAVHHGIDRGAGVAAWPGWPD